MEVRCHTPFAPLCFKSRDAVGATYDVFVVKATYDIVDDVRLKISQDQEPVCVADRHYGEVNVTSVSHPSDLAPHKPEADVMVVASAHAPGGRPAPHWYAEARLGDTARALRITGPRWWRRGLAGGWRLTEPEPALEVPVRWEYAYGGTITNERGERDAFLWNPVGRGWGRGLPTEVKELEAPQIEGPHDLVMDFGREHIPVGLGAIARAWQPRLGLAGTYDEAWKESQWPLPPHDFDERHYNDAPLELRRPAPLSGGEPFSAMNLTRSGSVRFEVPRWQVDVRLRYRDGKIERYPTSLDTLLVDLVAGKVLATHRVRVPERGPLRVVEVCMTGAT